MNLPPLPEVLIANVAGYGGDRGEAWLRQLPTLVAAAADRWQLRDLAPLSNLSFNYLMRGRRGRDGVVVKFLWGCGALAGETVWLRAQQGRGAVRLLDAGAELGAYLMEELVPATPATVLDDGAATEVIGSLIAALTEQPAPAAGLPTVAGWFGDLRRFEQRPPPGIDAATVRAARAIADELTASTAEPRLLHGDLHHDNVLAADAGWRAIDPKGVAGDPAHECAAMLRNGLGAVATADLSDCLRSRVGILAAVTGFDRARIAGWGCAQTVLSCCWSAVADARNAIDRHLAVAAALRPLYSDDAG